MNVKQHILNNLLEGIKGIRKYFKPNDNKNTIYQILWDVVKGFPRGKFIAWNACLGK